MGGKLKKTRRSRSGIKRRVNSKKYNRKFKGGSQDWTVPGFTITEGSVLSKRQEVACSSTTH